VQRRPGRRRALLAGGLWALAAVFKLHVLLAFPLLLLRRRFHVVLGALAAGVGLLIVSATVMPTATYEYVGEAMPRMIRYGINPPPGSELGPAVRQALFAGYPPGVAHAHGGGYLRFAIPFDDHASLVWALAGEEARYPGLLSLLVAGLMAGTVAWAIRRRAPDDARQAPEASLAADRCGTLREREDLAWLVLALCCVLLAAPLTWPMNTVWLLPAVFVALAPPGSGAGWARRYAGIVVGVVGLGLVALPDRFAWPWPRSLYWVSGHKYVLGELAVAAAMVYRLVPSRRRATAVADVGYPLRG